LLQQGILLTAVDGGIAGLEAVTDSAAKDIVDLILRGCITQSFMGNGKAMVRALERLLL
jgi:hypothetical protein